MGAGVSFGCCGGPRDAVIPFERKQQAFFRIVRKQRHAEFAIGAAAILSGNLLAVAGSAVGAIFAISDDSGELQATHSPVPPCDLLSATTDTSLPLLMQGNTTTGTVWSGGLSLVLDGGLSEISAVLPEPVATATSESAQFLVALSKDRQKLSLVSLKIESPASIGVVQSRVFSSTVSVFAVDQQSLFVVLASDPSILLSLSLPSLNTVSEIPTGLLKTTLITVPRLAHNVSAGMLFAAGQGADGDGQIVRISVLTQQVTASVPVVALPGALAFGPFDNGPLTCLTANHSLITWLPAGLSLVRRNEEAALAAPHLLLVQRHRRLWLVPLGDQPAPVGSPDLRSPLPFLALER